jgi:hypothetical protein
MQKCCELLTIHKEDLTVSLPDWSQDIIHGFITTPQKIFPNNDDLQTCVCKSVYTIPNTSFLHASGSYQKDGIGSMPWEYKQCAKVWLCCYHHLSACIPGKSKSFLKDPDNYFAHEEDLKAITIYVFWKRISAF